MSMSFLLLAGPTILVLTMVLLFVREDRRLRKISAIDQERKSLLAVLSHQLRTHLTSISWYTDLLQEGEFGKLKISQLEAMDKINAGSDTAVRILDRILHVSQVERETIVLKPIAVDVNKEVGRVVREYKDQAIRKKDKIVYKKAKKRIVAQIDPLILHSILEVLLSNAVTYTPKGGTVTVTLKEEDKNIEIAVEDTGIGIPPYEQKHIFSKFYRGDQAKKESTKGNGLGLYLVKQLLDYIKGSIKFKSEEGEGTTFTVSIPRA